MWGRLRRGRSPAAQLLAGLGAETFGCFPSQGFCVYCLWDDRDVLLYVGQTTNLLRRLGEHQQSPTRGAFVRVSLFRCYSERQMHLTEEWLIDRLQPPLNVWGTRDQEERANSRMERGRAAWAESKQEFAEIARREGWAKVQLRPMPEPRKRRRYHREPPLAPPIAPGLPVPPDVTAEVPEGGVEVPAAPVTFPFSPELSTARFREWLARHPAGWVFKASDLAPIALEVGRSRPWLYDKIEELEADGSIVRLGGQPMQWRLRPLLLSPADAEAAGE
jgi:hypothetical protein